jgi:membrane-associated protease RseP (regulator of RpoE activity)
MSTAARGLLAAALLALAGCAAPTTRPVTASEALVQVEAQRQQEIALRSQLDQQARLLRVAYPLLRAAVERCADQVRPSIGVISATSYSFERKVRDTAIRALGLGEVPTALYVVPGAPGEAAGVRAGDVLVAIDGRPVPTGEGAVKALNEELVAALTPGKPASVSVVRAGARQELSLTPVAICDVPPVLQVSDQVNAFTNGEAIAVTRGMLRFADNDQELALVIAHELAHATMGHVDAKMQNFVLGTLLDILAAAYGVNTQGTFGKVAAGAYSKAFEAEADYVGLYLMAQAGLPVDNAADFWRRMAAEHPGSIHRSAASSHPSTPERFLAIEGAIAEIAAKRASGAPLTPEYKAGAAPAPAGTAQDGVTP